MNDPHLFSAAVRTRTTVVHVRDEHDVYIGRAMPGRKASEFQNPFRIGKDGTRPEVLQKFRQHLLQMLERDPSAADRLRQLKGLRLGCWCKPHDCHGDVLAEWLDGAAAPEPTVLPTPQLDLF
jgi:hypothetical protein